MNKFFISLFFTMSISARADIALIWSDPMIAPNIIYNDNGIIHAAACPPYTVFDGKSVQELRNTCALEFGVMRTGAFANVLDSRRYRYFDESEILTQTQISEKTGERQKRIDFEKAGGSLSQEDRETIKRIESELRSHEKASQGRNEFETQKSAAIRAVNSDSELLVVTPQQADSYALFQQINLHSYASYCGNSGSIEERIQDCTIFANEQTGSYKLVQKIGVDSLSKDSASRVYYNSATGVFVSGANVPQEILDSYQSSFGANWRYILDIEKEPFPESIKSAGINRTTALINTDLKFQSRIHNRSNGDYIELKLEKGIMTVQLYSINGVRFRELNRFNLAILKINAREYREQFKRFQWTGTLWEHQGYLNESLLEFLDMGYIFLFPIPLAINIGYSLAYPPAIIRDIFSAESVAYRKFKRLIRGNNVRVSDQVFDAVQRTLRTMSIPNQQ